MAKFIIRPKDYRDLDGVNSEKNIISNVNGREYIINTNENTLLNDTTLNPDTFSQLYYSQPYKTINNGVSNVKVKPNLLQVSSEKLTAKAIGSENAFARVEKLIYEGSYSFITESVIDKDNVTCEFEIDYKKLYFSSSVGEDKNRLRDSNYKINSYTPLFDEIEFITEPNESGNPKMTENKTKDFLTLPNPSVTFKDLFKTQRIEVFSTNRDYCRVADVKIFDTYTQVFIEYSFTIWLGTYSEKLNFLLESSNELNVLAVNSINIKTYSNTITTKENTFSEGIKDSIPIFLGYLSVSFAVGIFAVENSMTVLETLLISMTILYLISQKLQ